MGPVSYNDITSDTTNDCRWTSRCNQLCVILVRYNDQTTTSVTHTNNIIYDTEDACYHDHEGYNVTLANNIFVKLGQTTSSHSDGALRSAAPTKTPNWHAAFNMRGNIITSTGPAPLFSGGSDLQWALSTFDNNVYWLDGDEPDSKLFP